MKAPENDRPVRGSDPNNFEPIPMFAEKYHGKRALDAAEWIGDALSWFTCCASPDEEFTADHLIESMGEDWGGVPTSSPAEVFPFVLELAATLADFALLSLWDGPPPNEYQERHARSALKLILGDDAYLLSMLTPNNKKEARP
jgi:hypothetical protein